MPNSRNAFVLFLLFVGAVAALLVFWAGAPVVGIMLDGAERRSPYLVLIFDNDRATENGFKVPGSVLPESAQLLWRAEKPLQAAGASVPERQRIELWRFASGGDFVRFATSSDYRRAERPRRAVELYGGADVIGDSAAAVTYPVLLAAVLDRREQASLTGATQAITPAAVKTLWEIELEPLGGAETYERFAMLACASEAVRTEWLWSDDTQFALELARKSFNALAVWELGGLVR
ncbi:MAG: hypothetical protein AAF648_13795 [Pseudomonadota bacterium]